MPAMRRTVTIACFFLFGLMVVGLAGCSREAPAPRSEPTAASEKPVPEVVRQMIEAHGGMDAWRSSPSIRFTERWGNGPATRVAVEQGARRVHQEVVGTSARMGWDGERAWSVDWKGAPPRMAAQLTYYFANLPWMTMDPGVELGTPATGKVWDDTTSYATVLMTFEPGVGDTPDDVFELFIHPQTHVLLACRYVMTYQAALPPGADRAPDHMVIFDRHETVNGLLVPTRFTVYEMDRRKIGECAVTDWSFNQPFDAAMAMMPEGAVVDTTTP
jgi:hypothetical protein